MTLPISTSPELRCSNISDREMANLILFLSIGSKLIPRSKQIQIKSREQRYKIIPRSKKQKLKPGALEKVVRQSLFNETFVKLFVNTGFGAPASSTENLAERERACAPECCCCSPGAVRLELGGVNASHAQQLHHPPR